MSAPRTKIFVGHLPDGCRSEDLLALFSKFGTVTECDVINKYGFVHMRTPEQAEAAIRGLNNYTLRGSAISVEHSKSKLHPEPGAPGRARGGGSGGGGNPSSNFGSRRGGPSRNGYSPQMNRGSMDAFRTMDQFTSDPYFNERQDPFGQNRVRPFTQSVFEQPSVMVTTPSSDYRQRAMPAPIGTRDQYSVSPSLQPRTDPYTRYMASSSSTSTAAAAAAAAAAASATTSSSPSFMYAPRSPPRTMGFESILSQNRNPLQSSVDIARRSFY